MSSRKARYRELIEASALFLGIAAALIFLVVLLFTRLRPGHQPIFYDSGVYFDGARQFYTLPSVRSLTGQERPVFAWPLLLLYRLIGADPSYNQLCLHNLLFSLSLTLLAMIWIARRAGAAISTALFAFALFCSFYPVTLAGAHFNGDVLMAAASLGLAACAMSWLSRPGLGISVALAALFACGVNVKPVFTPWAVAWMGLIWGFSAVTGKLRKPDYVAKLIGLTAATVLLVWFFWPIRLWQYIKGIYFNNQTLDNFVSQSTRLESLFWFPIELYRMLPIVQLILFVSVLAYLAALAFKDRKRLLESMRRLGPLWVAWLLSFAFISVFLRSKDARSYLLLFPSLFILATVTAARACERREKERLRLAIGTLAALLASIVTFLQWGAGFNRPSVGVPFMPFETVESSGMLELYSAMRGDFENVLKTKAAAEPVSALLLQNQAMFTSANLHFLPWSLGTLSRPAPLRPTMVSQDATTRFGMWGSSGGIPQGFFSSLYVLHCAEGSCYTDNPAARRIAARLTENDPAFMEGLTRVARIQTAYGLIEVLRRDHLPGTRTFVRIVRELNATDERNLWNYPFVLAASRLDSSLKGTEASFREFVQRGRIPSYFEYARSFAWGRAFLANDPVALGDVTYPGFFERQTFP